MKRFRIILFATITILGLVFVACSDKSTNNAENSQDYYKMNVGNYWYYQTDATDKNNNVTPGTTIFDSTVVAGVLNYQGKNAYKTLSFMSDTTKDTSYYSVDGSKIYRFLENLGNAQFRIPFDRWILLGDVNGTKWTIIDTNVTVPIEVQKGVNASLIAQVKLIGETKPKENLVINSNSVECQVFTQTATIKGILDLTLTQINIDQTIPIKYYFAKHIGLVKVTQGSTTITLPLIGERTIPGYIQNIIRYHVN